MTSPHAATLVAAGITGLQLRHREAQKGILSFFERLLETCVRLNSQSTYQLAHQCAEPLIAMLVKALSGLLPAYAIDENQGCIGDVLWNLKLLDQALFQVQKTPLVKSSHFNN